MNSTERVLDLLQTLFDRVKGVPELGADVAGDHDDGDRDASGDQTVFDGRRTLLVTQEKIESFDLKKK